MVWRSGVPNQRVMTLVGASPWDPRSSGIGFLLSRSCGFPPLILTLSARGRGDGRLTARTRTAYPRGRGGRRFRRGDKYVDFGLGQVVVVAVVEPHHRRELAGAEALDLLVAEEPVGRYLVRFLHADRLLDVVDDLIGAAQRAAQVRAHVEVVLADRREMKERVERSHPLDVAGIELERRGDLAHRLGRQVAELLLGQIEGGHDRGTWLRKLRGELANLLEDVGRESAHLSTSPSTVSAVPMIAIMSAIMWLSAMRSSACRLTNEAERNFTLR